MTILTVRFDEALEYAHAIHREHARRGIPMIAHLLDVTSQVLQLGGDEDEAIGALLHDAAEDAGGRERLSEIRDRFGDAVAQIVHECTDSYDDPPPPWRERKERYLAQVPTAGPSSCFVSATDKLCNVRELVRALRDRGDEVWMEYEGGREGRRWYFGTLVNVFRAAGGNPALGELERAVAELETLAR